MHQPPIFEQINLDHVKNLVDENKNKYFNISRVTKLKTDPFFKDENMKEKIRTFLSKNINKSDENIINSDKNITESDNDNSNINNEISENLQIKDSNITKNISDEEFIKKISEKKEKDYCRRLHQKIELWNNEHKKEIDTIYSSVKTIFNKNKVIIPVSDTKLYPYFVQHLYFIYHNLM